jgi:hypothetical protein
MSGPMTHISYLSDDGNAYRVRVPDWVATMTGDAAATTEPALPKGYRTRKRYLRVTATGREHRIVVGDVTKAAWTDAFGTATTIPTLGSGTATAVTYQGRTGERDKAF